MEAKNFMRELKRNCILNGFRNCENCKFKNLCEEPPHELNSVIDYIEQWSEENPIKTRQSEFLKLYPNVSKFSNGTIKICPCVIDTSLKGACVECEYHNQNCDYAKYWNEEVE